MLLFQLALISFKRKSNTIAITSTVTNDNNSKLSTIFNSAFNEIHGLQCILKQMTSNISVIY